MLKIGVLVSGGGTNLQAIIDSIKNGIINNTEIVTVVSSNPNAYALTRAEKNNINNICIKKKDFKTIEEYDAALINHFKKFDTDLIVMAGFMVLIGKSFIKAFENRIINIHPSLIPSFCGNGFYGIKVHEAALKKGVKVTGATVHFVTEETDAGPIILQKAVYIDDCDDAESLQKKVMKEAEWIIFPEAINLFAQGKIKIEGNIVRRIKK